MHWGQVLHYDMMHLSHGHLESYFTFFSTIHYPMKIFADFFNVHYAAVSRAIKQLEGEMS